MTYCFFHRADLDGHCSGAVVQRRIPDCIMMPFDYGDKFPWHLIKAEDTVVMTDLSLQGKGEMARLRDKCRKFIWIDHHSSAINDHGWMDLEGKQDTSVAACELAWEYFYPGDVLPLAVKYASLYDSWKHENRDDILNFTMGMANRDTLPETGASKPIWKRLLSNSNLNCNDVSVMEEISLAGFAVREYLHNKYASQSKACAFTTQLAAPGLDPLRVLACNGFATGSHLIEPDFDPVRHDAMCVFYMLRDGTFRASLYSTKQNVDCSRWAKALGGGGHKGAAGFTCKELPWSRTMSK